MPRATASTVISSCRFAYPDERSVPHALGKRAVRVTSVSARAFRCFDEVTIEPAPDGLTVLYGRNGSGKTSLVEAISFVATGASFRGSTRDSMIRTGEEGARVEARLALGERRAQVDAVITCGRPTAFFVNGRRERTSEAIADVLRVTTFSAADLDIVQGGPGNRRDVLDALLGSIYPRMGGVIAEVDRALRQRGALLKQLAGGARTEDLATLDVWDDRLARSGTTLSSAREELCERLEPIVRGRYNALSGSRAMRVGIDYRRSWEGDLSSALGKSRDSDLFRQVTSQGPHRDEVELTLDGRPARTEASRGEQRCLAISLRLASHELLAEDHPGDPPVLLLDDVFSELDEGRARALLGQLPEGQTILTTSSSPPPGASAARIVSFDAATGYSAVAQSSESHQ